MKKQYLHILVLTMALIIGLSACEMKASTPPPEVAEVDNMATMEAIPTQTYLAKEGGAGGQAPDGGADVDGEPLAEKTITPAITSESGETTTVPTMTPVPTATSTPEPPAEVTSYGLPSSYTIHKGEHPFCLGRRFNINPDDLLAHNGLYRGVTLYPGYTLQIPSSARPFPGNRELRAHPADYTVQVNDTFYSIACLFGDVDPRNIAEYNNMSVSQNLTPGNVISIP